jgi:hypothetical protein
MPRKVFIPFSLVPAKRPAAQVTTGEETLRLKTGCDPTATAAMPPAMSVRRSIFVALIESTRACVLSLINAVTQVRRE